MAQGIEDKVIFSETDDIKIAAFLRERDYDLVGGHIVRKRDYDLAGTKFPIGVGIIAGSEPIRLFGIPIPLARRDHIGDLSFDSETSCTLQIYGRQYVPELTNLAKEIVKTFGAKISIQLTSENPRKETLHGFFPSNYRR